MYLVLGFAVLWTSVYFMLVYWNNSCSHEWNCRVVAMLHSLIITKLVETCLVIGPWPFHTLGQPNSLMQSFNISMSAGYFLFEISWCLYMRTEAPIMLLHHFISVTSLLYSAFSQNCGSDVSAVLWGSELTNPFLQIRWFLRKTSLNNTTYAFLNDVVFVLMFAMVRIGVGTCLAYTLYFSTKTPTLMRIGGYTFYLIGIIWMWDIVNFARRRIDFRRKTR